MSDISMCPGNNCKKKNTCFRYLADKDKYAQSYCQFTLDKEGKCEYYWEVKSKSELKRLNKQNAF